MNEDLLNVIGSFSEVSLDCIEKQNEEIEELEKENTKLKEVIEEIRTEISALVDRYFCEEDFHIEDTDLDRLLQILDKYKN